VLTTLLTVVAVVAILALLIRSAIRSAKTKKSLLSVYLKILANYVQFMVLVSAFNGSWPEEMTGIFEIFWFAGSVSDQLPRVFVWRRTGVEVGV